MISYIGWSFLKIMITLSKYHLKKANVVTDALSYKSDIMITGTSIRQKRNNIIWMIVDITDQVSTFLTYTLDFFVISLS